MTSLGADLVGKILAEQFHQLARVPVTYLGEGCDSVAFDVGSRWVFRFPKRPDVEQQLFVEQRLLPRLAPHLPLHVPDYQFIGAPSVLFPMHFGGYARLPGEPAIQMEDAWRLRTPALAEQLGAFLSALHAFPVADAAQLGVPHECGASALSEIQAEALESFGHVRDVAPDAPLRHWEDYLAAGAVGEGVISSTMVHNDLAGEHLLYDSAAATLTGVIDWSDVAIGDAAADFAGLFHWGGSDLVARVLPHYRVRLDAGLLARGQYRAACRGVGDVTYGISTSRPEYVAAGLRALRLCAGDG
jgi:aminoglycoside phosphotransferase (APT) family kinase protein